MMQLASEVTISSVLEWYHHRVVEVVRPPAGRGWAGRPPQGLLIPWDRPSGSGRMGGAGTPRHQGGAGVVVVVSSRCLDLQVRKNSLDPVGVGRAVRTPGCLPGKEQACRSPLSPPLSPGALLSLSPLPCHSVLSPPLPAFSHLHDLPMPASGLLQPATRLLTAAPGCAPDPRNHAGHLHAAETHPGATGPRGGPAARLPPGQLLHDRGGRGPAHVSPPAGQVPTEGFPPPLPGWSSPHPGLGTCPSTQRRPLPSQLAAFP